MPEPCGVVGKLLIDAERLLQHAAKVSNEAYDHGEFFLDLAVRANSPFRAIGARRGRDASKLFSQLGPEPISSSATSRASSTCSASNAPSATARAAITSTS
jgi:hypothetical protein